MSDNRLTFPYENIHRGELSSLALAHVGDAVFELFVRTRLCAHELTAERLHRRTVELVCASAQAAAARAGLRIPVMEKGRKVRWTVWKMGERRYGSAFWS